MRRSGLPPGRQPPPAWWRCSEPPKERHCLPARPLQTPALQCRRRSQAGTNLEESPTPISLTPCIVSLLFLPSQPHVMELGLIPPQGQDDKDSGLRCWSSQHPQGTPPCLSQTPTCGAFPAELRWKLLHFQLCQPTPPSSSLLFSAFRFVDPVLSRPLLLNPPHLDDLHPNLSNFVLSFSSTRC